MRKAFTLTEVLVAITIMSIMSGVMALSSATVGQQSARREAERVAAFIQGHINRENIVRRGLWFKVNEDNIQVWHGLTQNSQVVPELKANSGCKYTPKNLCYNVSYSVQTNILAGSVSLQIHPLFLWEP